MSQIEELQHRIIAAMERIGSGLEAVQTAPAAEGESPDAALLQQLEDERAQKVQAQEQMVSLREGIRAERAARGEEIAELRAGIETLKAAPANDEESDALREQLAEANAKLASVEAAREELAEAKAALENQDELEVLKKQVAALQEQNAELSTAIGEASALEDENARLRSELADTERVAELNAELDMLRAERTSHGAAMSRLDDDLQRMRKANEQLRNSVDELREAAENGLPDAALLNRATVAELEATRAAQATDAAEAHAVLARLEPLLSQARLADGEVE